MSTKDQTLSAALHGEALLMAKRSELQPLIDNLREVAQGRNDIRTECAGVMFTKREMADLYKQFLAGLVLATANEALAVAPGVTEIQIVALRSTPADAARSARKRSWLPELLARR
jgi:hypothetical protein